MHDRLIWRYLLAALVLISTKSFAQDSVWQSPPPGQAEGAGLLLAICPANIQTDPRLSVYYPVCRPCPKFTTDGAQPPQIAMHGIFAPRSAIYGSFTEPGVVEAVVSFEGCESQASQFGGSILERNLTGSWVMVNYTPALITTACHTYRLKTGRDLLLCEGDDHSMDAASQWISVWDFSKETAPESTTIFRVADTRVACGQRAVWGSIDNAELEDLDGDGMPELILTVSVGQGTFNDPWGSCKPDAAASPVEKQKLNFLFHPDANRFLPAADSASSVARLEQMFKDALVPRPEGPGAKP